MASWLCVLKLTSQPISLQALGGEAMQLLWALAETNPRALSAFAGLNLELGCQGTPRDGGPWKSVLVSTASGNRSSQSSAQAEKVPPFTVQRAFHAKTMHSLTVTCGLICAVPHVHCQKAQAYGSNMTE